MTLVMSLTILIGLRTGVIVENKYKFTIYEGEFESGFRHGYGKASIFVRSGLFVGTYRWGSRARCTLCLTV